MDVEDSDWTKETSYPVEKDDSDLTGNDVESTSYPMDVEDSDWTKETSYPVEKDDSDLTGNDVDSKPRDLIEEETSYPVKKNNSDWTETQRPRKTRGRRNNTKISKRERRPRRSR